MNRKIRFNTGWEFAKSPLETADCGGLSFEPVDLPHDWQIYDTRNLYADGIGWYRKLFVYHGEDDEVLLYFEGVYMDSTVYVNGKNVGEWKYGYTSFEHEITHALRDGENEILVRVVYRSPNSRWYTGAGIYRDVWLKTREKAHFVTDGIYVHAAPQGDVWKVCVESELSAVSGLHVSHRLLYGEETVASYESDVSAGEEAGCDRQVLTVRCPRLWSPEEPHLYRLVSRLYREDRLVEEQVQNVGLRTAEFSPDRGLIVNGRPYKLHGVCEHHDLGALGSAFNRAALRRRFALLKQMGVNAVRTAHNMPAPDWMELADEMGLFVDSEAFDMWERPKNPFDYARFFKDWHERDVKSWVMRDRNHPSLLMWSIGNEIYDMHADAHGLELTQKLADCVWRYDPYRNGKVTFGSNYMPWENTQKCADISKVPGYNYAEKYYRKHHEAHPDWTIYGSETASIVQSRGIYHFPLGRSILSDDDSQCSALGNSPTSWGASSSEACICADRDTPFSMGQFIWSGFDYIGEPTPYHTKNSYFGQLDTATFKKDSFYIYQAEWTDYNQNPMIHIFPYWDFSEGQRIDVRVCSNAPQVELLCNGVSLGTRRIDHLHGQKLIADWNIPYAQGKLTAIAYDERGQAIAADQRESFGEAAATRLCPDKNTLIADGSDLLFVAIAMCDSQGRAVENACSRVRVEVSGEGRLVGLDNGDSTDFDAYKGLRRRLFSGRLMAVIASTLIPGAVHVRVCSLGLPDCTADFESIPAANRDITGVCARTRNRAYPCLLGREEEIPLRKIELVSEGERILTPDRRTIVLHAQLYPENTSYREVEWSAVMDGGVPCVTALVEASGLEAHVTASGDGMFRVRCASKNGSGEIRLISELEMEATGLGAATINPYGFIFGSLCDYTKGEVSNGNERGVATARDGETQVGFRNLDFGSYGSDTVTLPVFALSDNAYPIEIWEGMPDEPGSARIATVVYQKHSIWNVYQPETFHLPRRIRGVTSLCFVLHQKVHIKGFSFTRLNRAFARNSAVESEHIYGDAFAVRKDRVENIGNNVSLEFGEMNFSGDGISRIVICGHSPIDRNTIHIRFSGEDGAGERIVEFTYSADYVERTFGLEKVFGRQRVTFVFLPGCNFDFQWFRFEK